MSLCVSCLVRKLFVCNFLSLAAEGTVPRKWQLFSKKVICKINKINNVLHCILFTDGKQFAGELQIIAYNGKRNKNSEVGT